MARDISLNELWESSPHGDRSFQADDASHLPEPAQQYLKHAIAAGTRLARAVRLRMHGEIKLQRWFPFKAEQVIAWGRGFIWSATVRMYGMPVRGSDRLVDGDGAMRWRLLGLIPVMSASGPDITRSAAGRVAGESMWLPSVLCSDEVSWSAPDPYHLRATFTAHGETTELDLSVDGGGALTSIKYPRWGNPGDSEFRYVDFGALVEGESTFGSYTIPSRLRAGWYFGSDRFESKGEFFRATIDDVVYR